MTTGYLLVDKPTGPTSHDVVTAVRKATGIRRVGHTGTLDPFASGLLVVLVGRATRLARFLVGQDKRYTGVIRLGVTTDTCDRTGAVLQLSDAWKTVTTGDIVQAMAAFVGRRRQQPPAFSAKKIDGKRAYRLARRGEAPDLPAQAVRIQSFTLTQLDGADASFEVVVGSGTYVRALARDLGAGLGCGAHLLELRRISVGPFTVDQAVSIDDITANSTRPAQGALTHLQTIAVDDAACESLRHGRAVPAPEAVQGPVVVMAKDELVAVAEVDGEHLKPRVVLAP